MWRDAPRKERGLLMKPHRFVLLFIVALLLAVGAIAVSCGDSNELTLEEYLRRIEALSDQADERFEPLVEALNQEFDAEPDRLEATREFFRADIPIVRDFLEGVDDLEPPAEVEGPHEETVAAGAEFLEILEDFTDRITGVESTSELEELLDDPELEAASGRFEEPCFALQDIADANGIDVDLKCEDEE